MPQNATLPCELNELRELSARVGRNPLLVQASSGNTSIKVDETLWIKASGKWLIHAQDENFLVSVCLTRARKCLREDIAIPEAGASIETAMHAVLPHKIVVHVHSVNTIAWAVRADAPDRLSARLAGIPWQWIPYSPSGASLALKIQSALSLSPETTVLVLGNHGLVVCGESCRAAEQLLADVEQRLAIDPRPIRQPVMQALATDSTIRHILSGGALYPCQAIFVPQTMSSKPQTELRRKALSRAESEMLAGLVNVVQRIDASAPIRYLTPAEVAHVLTEESASYRQNADANGNSKAFDLGA